MKKELKKIFVSVALCFISATGLMAQHLPNYVEPGCNGPLPEIKEIPQGDGSFLPVFNLERVYVDMIMNNRWYIDADVTFPTPQWIGTEKIRLQEIGEDGQWVDVCNGGDYRETTYNDNFCISLSGTNSYRLRFIGGEQDGKVSNAITIPYPVPQTNYGSSRWMNGTEVNIGTVCEAPSVYNVSTKEMSNIEEPSPYILYNWYRRNPYTYEETMIEGAHDKYYTVSAEDVGYEILGETCGDNVHTSFLVRYYTTVVGMSIKCYPEYQNVDGIILNTEYVLPDPNIFRLVSNEWNGETYEEISLPVEVTEVVPGQYKIKADISSLGEYPYVVLKSSDPSLSFVGEYGPGRLRNFELSIYPQACNFQVMFNGNKKEAAVDFLRPNIDGKMIVDTTFVAGEDTTIVYVNGGNYYLRARETDETIPTYYPDVANWNDAQMITVPTFTEDWYDSIFVVNLQPKPVPLTGTGVIEGKVTHEPETVSFARRWMKLSTAENENVNVLLYGADGNLTATTTVSDEGVYRFENLPFGTYSVVVDAAGYVIESNPDITISADNPTADNIDYTITNDGKVVRDGAGDALPGDANDDKVIDVADITTIAAYILGKTPETFNAANADANQDGSIDVSDITATAGIILAPAPSYQSVDLGLTSGVKWATFNVGASKPEEIGDFYAWGETKTKSEYTWENYPYAEGGIGPEISGADNDVAHVKWGGSWRLPTNDEIYELTMECDWETTQMNGVSGYLVKSQKNGNSIFLPLAGKNFYGIENPGENGYYRSGTGGSGFSYVIYISPFGAVCMHDAGAAGYSVRPVCK